MIINKEEVKKAANNLVIEFAEWIVDYERTPHLNRLETTEELFEMFKISKK